MAKKVKLVAERTQTVKGFGTVPKGGIIELPNDKGQKGSVVDRMLLGHFRIAKREDIEAAQNSAALAAQYMTTAITGHGMKDVAKKRGGSVRVNKSSQDNNDDSDTTDVKDPASGSDDTAANTEGAGGADTDADNPAPDTDTDNPASDAGPDNQPPL